MSTRRSQSNGEVAPGNAEKRLQIVQQALKDLVAAGVPARYWQKDEGLVILVEGVGVCNLCRNMRLVAELVSGTCQNHAQAPTPEVPE